VFPLRDKEGSEKDSGIEKYRVATSRLGLLVLSQVDCTLLTLKEELWIKARTLVTTAVCFSAFFLENVLRIRKIPLAPSSVFGIW
jgi:hypothetical protein